MDMKLSNEGVYFPWSSLLNMISIILCINNIIYDVLNLMIKSTPVDIKFDDISLEGMESILNGSYY